MASVVFVVAVTAVVVPARTAVVEIVLGRCGYIKAWLRSNSKRQSEILIVRIRF
jgi:hypothetical protein